jgi:hypothetical protein
MRWRMLAGSTLGSLLLLITLATPVAADTGKVSGSGGGIPCPTIKFRSGVSGTVWTKTASSMSDLECFAPVPESPRQFPGPPGFANRDPRPDGSPCAPFQWVYVNIDPTNGAHFIASWKDPQTPTLNKSAWDINSTADYDYSQGITPAKLWALAPWLGSHAPYIPYVTSGTVQQGVCTPDQNARWVIGHQNAPPPQDDRPIPCGPTTDNGMAIAGNVCVDTFQDFPAMPANMSAGLAGIDLKAKVAETTNGGTIRSLPDAKTCAQLKSIPGSPACAVVNSPNSPQPISTPFWIEGATVVNQIVAVNVIGPADAAGRAPVLQYILRVSPEQIFWHFGDGQGQTGGTSFGNPVTHDYSRISDPGCRDQGSTCGPEGITYQVTAEETYGVTVSARVFNGATTAVIPQLDHFEFTVNAKPESVYAFQAEGVPSRAF